MPKNEASQVPNKIFALLECGVEVLFIFFRSVIFYLALTSFLPEWELEDSLNLKQNQKSLGMINFMAENETFI